METLTKELNKTYQPAEFEARIYKDWLDKGYFRAEIDHSKTPFTIVMPPPNITGHLHMGHALNNSLQDMLIRYKRMKGFCALWVPGTDHASIATEVKIVEKLASEGLSKESLGREKFLERAWEWKAQYGGRIVEQLKKLGCSCDWSREAFTMDNNLSEAVKHVFVSLYDKGYIYQGSRIINWCPDCKTALSDAEVEYSAHSGQLWHIKYPIENSQEFIVVATTRPETMLGDTAVAVNPDDKRYKALIGKYVILPLTNRRIPIVADGYVDKSFGSGAVKITPAHDPNDFEVGLRHNLETIRVLNDDGSVNELGGKYQGLDRYEARKQILADLKEMGLLLKTEQHKHNVGQCYRCDTVIEPIVSKQWFVKMEKLAKPALEALDNNSLRFTPKRFDKIYRHWLVNIKDWCISRQLWWGHRIPAFTCQDCGELTVTAEDLKKCPKCSSANILQDEDVLDTWFSSALWPFSTLGYPNKTEDLEYFYPTDVLVTAPDIIFFWVVRMVFSGLEHMGKVPFNEVIINGIVRDKIGRKMSKSLGNGIDPLDLIDRYGTDALRFSLLWGNSLGKDIKFSEDKVIADRTFINKLWNAARFVLSNAEKIPYTDIEDIKLSTADKWILHKYNELVKNATRAMDRYNPNLALKYMYQFVYNDFCDWYIELAKVKLYGGDEQEKKNTMSVLMFVLQGLLKVMHPIIPFVTEEIYQHIPNVSGTIMLEKYPEYSKTLYNITAYKNMESVISLIGKIRELRAEMKVSQTRRTAIYVLPKSKPRLVEETLPYIEKLGMGKSIEIIKSEPSQCANIIDDLGDIYIPILDMVDISQEKARLERELQEAQFELNRAQGKLNNQGFVAKAPQSLIEQEKAKVAKYSTLVESLNQKLKELQDI